MIAAASLALDIFRNAWNYHPRALTGADGNSVTAGLLTELGTRRLG
jgi:hypothetical protein